MESIKETRRRLDALTTEGIKEYSSSPAISLADCRQLQDRLRELKHEVLARIAGLRASIQERATTAQTSRRSLRETWRQREGGAKRLLADVQERVIGLVDGKQGDAIEGWSRINEEIDARLARLAKVESRLTRVVSEGAVTRRSESRPPKAEAPDDDDLYAAVGTANRQQEAKNEAGNPANDDLYAAVGADIRKGESRDAYCPHCSQGLDPDDRFCRRCGHRIS